MAGIDDSNTKQATKPPSLAKPQETVTVTVGRVAESQTFKIHKETLCYHSPFFATAFNSSFIEGKTQVMTLDDVDGTAFGLLVAWLYNKTISNQDLAIEDQIESKNPTPSWAAPASISALATRPDGMNFQARINAELKALSGPEPCSTLNALDLAKLWVLGQRFLIPDLQNCALAKIHSVLASPDGRSHPQLKEIAEYAYSGEYNELRVLVIEILAFVDTQWPLEEFPKRILVDTMKCLKTYGGRQWVSSYCMHKAEYFFVKGGTETTVINVGGWGEGPAPGWGHSAPAAAW